MKSFVVYQENLTTPLGELHLLTDAEQHIRAIDWHDHVERMHRLLRQQYKQIQVTIQSATQASPAAQVLQAYFAGDIAAIDSLPVALGGTDFQRQVWSALREIPAGQTLSYGELARRIGRPKAVRAVGLANGANPVGVVVPCHRVVGSNGSLTGYGGGLHRKAWLLAHEQRP